MRGRNGFLHSMKSLLALAVAVLGVCLVISIIAAIFGGVGGFVEAWRMMVGILGVTIAFTTAIVAPFLIASVIYTIVMGWLDSM